MKKNGRDRQSGGRRDDNRRSRNRTEGGGRIRADRFSDRKDDVRKYDDRKSGKSERSDDKKKYSSGEREERSYERRSRDERGDGQRKSRASRDDKDGRERKTERPARDGNSEDQKSKREERPFKAGTRPAGRRAREEGEKRPRTTSDSQREWIRKDRSFDRQDKPYKAGTRPSGRGYESNERGGEERSYDKRKSGGDRSYERRENDRDRRSRYGDKKNYRDKPFDRPQKFDRTQKKDDGKIRLNKYIANSGICSRREADEYIAAGVVTVNGQIITEMGYKVNPGDEVKFHDKKLRSEKMVYVLLNKPKDFITTTDDDRNRKTVMNLVKDAGRERIYPVGRLDRATTGVLLLTNDGELTKKLTHPSHEIKKIYQVELDKSLKPSDLEKIKNGIELEDGVAEVDEIIYSGDSNKVLGIELHSGRNRIVRRIFEALDYRVVKLDRVYFAGLTKKDLPRGRWRFLTEMEVNMLKMLTAKKPKKVTEKFE